MAYTTKINVTVLEFRTLDTKAAADSVPNKSSPWLADGCLLAVTSHGLSSVCVLGESQRSLSIPLIMVSYPRGLGLHPYDFI